MRRISICNVPVDVASRNEAMERCGSFLRNHRPHHIVTINPEFVVEAQKNELFRNVLQKSDLALADGFGIALAARWLYEVKLERIPGVDFMVDLCALAEKEDMSVFFLGGRGGVAKKTAEVLQKKFLKLKVAGWSEEVSLPLERSEMLQWSISRAASMFALNGIRPGTGVEGCVDLVPENSHTSPNPLLLKEGKDPDIIFIALGSPKQELWIAENLPKLPGIKIAMGVGGAFDMISGKRKRAPQLLRKLGLEWLWRLALEPGRWRRIIAAVFQFSLLFIRVRKTREPGCA